MTNQMDNRYPAALEEEEVQTINVAEEINEEDPEMAQQEVFPGGPLYDQLEQWKAMYNNEVYLTEIDDENIFIWRPIKRKEYKDIAKIPNADNFYKEERICEKSVVFPEKYSFMNMSAGKAGIPTLLSELILEKSGFVAKTGAMRLS
jgi:hypothetical protein